MRGDKNCQVIEGLEREWRDALCSKDMDRLRALVHPDFVLIGTRSTGPFMMQPATNGSTPSSAARSMPSSFEVQDATVRRRRDDRHGAGALAPQISRPR